MSATAPNDSRSGLVASLLSAIVPGAGQMYGRHRWRGLAFFAPLVILVLGLGIYRVRSTSVDLLAALVQPQNLAALLIGNVAIVGWRLYAAVDAYQLVSNGRGRSKAIWAGFGLVLVAVMAPHVVAGAYTLRTIDLLNNVFVSAEPTEIVVPITQEPPPVTVVPDPALTEAEPDNHPVTIDRPSRDLVTVEYRSVGLIFRDGVGDPDAIAVQRELRTGTPEAPFVDFGERVDEDRITILLAGGDRGPGRPGLRTDTMIVATVDVNTGAAALFGIPRNLKRVPLPDDIRHAFDELTLEIWEWEPDEDEDGFPDDWVDLDGDEIPDMPELHCHCYPDLLNHLHGDGLAWDVTYPDSRDPGMDLLADTLGNMIGLEIDYWVLIDMKGFVRLIDAMGGVDVNVVNPLHVGVSPSEEGLPKAIVNVEEGSAHLTGSEALAYVRWRKGSSDYVRMSRQRCLIRSVAAGADPVTVLRSFTAMADAIEESVLTDIPLTILPDLIEVMGQVDLNQIATIGLVPPYFNDGRTPGRYPVPDVDRMRAKVAETLAGGVEETTLIGTEAECGI